MKGLDTLIKLTKRNLDALRRQLVNLENQKEQLIQLSVKLENDLRREREIAATTMHMGKYLDDFAKKTKARQVEIAKEVIKLDGEIFQVTAAITEAFGELKKYEIAKENEKARQAEKQKRVETAMLDEMGLQQFVRRGNDSES